MDSPTPRRAPRPTPGPTQSPNQSPTPRPIPNPSPARKLTARQERFCQSFVLFPNSAYAARDAGYSPKWARKQGSRLMTTTRIRARIGEILAAMARDNGRGQDVLIGKLEVVYRRAIEDHHYTAAARAVELQARLGGQRFGKPIAEIFSRLFHDTMRGGRVWEKSSLL